MRKNDGNIEAKHLFFAISNHLPEELHRVKGFYGENINPLK